MLTDCKEYFDSFYEDPSTINLTKLKFDKNIYYKNNKWEEDTDDTKFALLDEKIVGNYKTPNNGTLHSINCKKFIFIEKDKIYCGIKSNQIVYDGNIYLADYKEVSSLKIDLSVNDKIEPLNFFTSF